VSASKPAVPEPTRIGKYEIVAKLGAGAFGTVYKAMDPELGRLVAIKTIRLEGLAASQASLDDLLARFRREAQVAPARPRASATSPWSSWREWASTA
jgi:serine/threonine protein kinase